MKNSTDSYRVEIFRQIMSFFFYNQMDYNIVDNIVDNL